MEGHDTKGKKHEVVKGVHSLGGYSLQDCKGVGEAGVNCRVHWALSVRKNSGMRLQWVCMR